MKGVRRQRTLHQEHYSINQSWKVSDGRGIVVLDWLWSCQGWLWWLSCQLGISIKTGGHSVQRTEGSSGSVPTTASRWVPEAGNDLYQEHYWINQYITLVKWKELIMKGVWRQRNKKRGTTCTRSTIELISTSRWSIGKSLSWKVSDGRGIMVLDWLWSCRGWLWWLSCLIIIRMKTGLHAGIDLHQ